MASSSLPRGRRRKHGRNTTKQNAVPGTPRRNVEADDRDFSLDSSADRSSVRPNRVSGGGVPPLALASVVAPAAESSFGEAVIQSTLRTTCLEFFDKNVNPIVRIMQQAQADFSLQLSQLRREVQTKASASDVAQVTAGAPATGNSVSTLVRLQELTDALRSKADVHAVPSKMQLNKMYAALDQKANLKDVPTAEEIVRKVSEQGLVGASDGGFSASQQGREQQEAAAAAAERRITEDVNALRAELQEVRARVATLEQGRSAPAPSDAHDQSKEMSHVKVFIAAAGARFDKQLKEVRKQVNELREETLGGANRWPGRALSGQLSPRRHRGGSASRCNSPTRSEAGSDVGSVAGSVAASVSESIIGLSFEEKAELKKVQAVVAAAGTVFAKELRDVRRQIRDVRAELGVLKESNTKK
eukprot:TRINITY_DN7958_c0_g1_i1.p1 TRINITY_DN7958_c0_g1~~TRINITY_DN7958_c0_g1_i1.p1  ORF type:complete len:416 (+),score=98.92 TRINITY_DN7958_c0_g1_i1:104-1351(+)